jgi:catechol 2,3-dioxygenase-like lactoylglutathione lyase family enzyme
MRRLAAVAILVRDYDEAIAWFTTALGFVLVEDVDAGEGKRWVKVAPETGGTALLLARAAGDQEKNVGRQAAGRVAFFLEVSDFDGAHTRMSAAGVVFEEPPRAEPYGRVAVFLDLYGNRWDLLEALPED